MKLLSSTLLLTLCIIFILASAAPRYPKPQRTADDRHAENLATKKQEIKKIASSITEILYLNSENIEFVIDTSKYLVIVYYDPEEEKTEYDLKIYAAEVLYAKPECAVGFVNIVTEKKIVHKHGVSFAPYVEIYVEGIHLHYTKKDFPLTPLNVEEFLMQLDIDSVKTWTPYLFNDPKEYLQLKFKDDEFHLLCVCNQASPEYELLKKYRAIPLSQLDIYVMEPKKKVIEALGFEHPNYTLPKRGPRNNVTLSYENEILIVNNLIGEIYHVPKNITTVQELHKFAKHHKYQPVNNYLHKKSTDLYAEAHPVIILFLNHVARKDPTEYLNVLNEAANKGLAGKINMFAVYAKHVIGKPVGVDLNTLQRLFIFDNINNPLYFDAFELTGNITADRIVQHYNDFLEGKLKHPYKTQENAPVEQDGLKVLTRANFEELIFKSNVDTVAFYHHECKQTCLKLIEVFQKVKVRLEQNDQIQFAICDLDKNELRDYIRAGKDPLIVIHRADNPKRSIDWGNRPDSFGQEALIEFIKAETSKPWKKPAIPIKDSLQNQFKIIKILCYMYDFTKRNLFFIYFFGEPIKQTENTINNWIKHLFLLFIQFHLFTSSLLLFQQMIGIHLSLIGKLLILSKQRVTIKAFKFTSDPSYWVQNLQKILYKSYTFINKQTHKFLTIKDLILARDTEI